MKVGRLAVLSALCAGLGGCPSFTNLKTARALDEGEFQMSIAPGAVGISVPTVTTAGSTVPGGNAWLPQGEIAARYGLADGFDVGGKIWIGGIELDSTISLLRGRFDLALAPGIGYFGFTGGSGTSSAFISEIPIYLPVLAGVNFGHGHQVVFGLQAIPDLVLGQANGNGSGAIFALFVGGTLGVSLRLTQRIRIMPELNVYAPAIGASVNGSTTSEFGNSGAVIYQFAVGFSFGYDGFSKHPSWQ